jgi:nucleoside-diphosphate-sugar epimerase
MSRIVVTGASGFVGRRVCEVLAAAGHDLVGTTRGSISHSAEPSVDMRRVRDQHVGESWRPVLIGADYVVHLAARVHVMHETADDPLQAFREANVLTTKAVASEAVRAGVKRLVFLSTIKVLGEATAGRPFVHGQSVAPDDPYSVSKCEAEEAVRSICSGGATDFVILRPPLICGPGVGGNLERVFSLTHRGLPVPLASVRNARAMLGLDNLVDVIELSLRHPDASGETLLVADDEALSTPDLFGIVARSMGKRARLFPVPVTILRAVGLLLHRSAEIDRLCGSLEIDISHTKQVLDWSPRVTPAEALQAAVEHYLQHRGELID